MSIVDKIRSGDVLSMSRFIRDVDDNVAGTEDVLKDLFKYCGKSNVLGVTGLPGAGKSSLISLLIGKYRKEGKKVGVIAVDPSSPFSGGAILGDRIRMQEHNSDPEVFIKSVATRGSFGGLSKSVIDIVRIMEAAGKEIVIIETVGVGQDEVDIVKIAGQVAVVTAPGLGDDIQAIKAGILEIADVFVVNKCDLTGADRAAKELLDAADNCRGEGPRPIVLTDAIHKKGIDGLLDELNSGFANLINAKVKSDYLKRRYRSEIELKVRDHLMGFVRSSFEANPSLHKVLDAVEEGSIDPYSAVKKIISELIKG